MWRTCLHPMASACPRHAVVLRSSRLSCSGRAACLSFRCCCMQQCTSPHLGKRSWGWEELASHLASCQARRRKSSCNHQQRRYGDSPCRRLPRAFHPESSPRGFGSWPSTKIADVLILTLCLLHSMHIFVSPSLSHPKVENLCESHCLLILSSWKDSTRKISHDYKLKRILSTRPSKSSHRHPVPSHSRSPWA